MRIGYGYDVHQLASGEELVIGGLVIPHEKGSVGHSDADVLLHVICDALLGALALGDIGTHFPDTDSTYRGIDSKILLRKTYDMVLERGWKLANVDSTVCLQRPKLKPHIQDMRGVIADVMGVDVEQVGIKATTTEWLGFVGKEEGISAHAVVLLEPDQGE
ncbi:MAG: 2-C-methyl-D-erythritol 2,4-cyclodiphosphate synthase [Bacteroidetes bacterium]|nr:2-C-methyl-D-erythritol 2,4-cyclodiphosphate synthase [Bacteroidota bacterium]MDA0902923.1 2-C-methyl-D-erythritol 2,4-cyclodiphosphate synthase [Bacteroidota bacterium]MDA1241661.1 2-C-methyl-D-erythritol 2,4-cyclodiphosphate synthase [Bacteroidota bacterium]